LFPEKTLWAISAPAGYGGVMPDRPGPYEVDVLPFVRPFTDELVESVDVANVDRLLDHGSGTGEVVLQLAAAGLDASVVALEPNATMMERLRCNVRGQHATELFQGRLSEYIAHNPEPQFSLVTSQLVLTFVDDPLTEL
jgi:ubiquinone/menaquinone biosynthesis C-methylase UbiE